jgi:PAS domain S-box-containing protein
LVVLRIGIGVSIIFVTLSLTTSLVAYDTAMTVTGLVRKTGALYSLFAVYFISMWTLSLSLLFVKWRFSTGLAKAQIQFLVATALIAGGGAIVSNLLLPFVTGRSNHSWIGPYFTLGSLILIAHAVIRHRLMSLRVVIHRGLTIAIATILSLIPLAIGVAFFWPRFADHLDSVELAALLFALTAVTLLMPPIRDVAGRLLDKYVYRTHANYQRTVREASQVLTRVLDLKTLLAFINNTIGSATECEGVGVYLRGEAGFAPALGAARHGGTGFALPERAAEVIAAALDETRDALVAEEVLAPALRDELLRLNWALVLPAISENVVIGAIVVGPKLSGDPFYPQDLDLLMTLANQAGIAIKNAQLYAQVVLANEYIENIVATIESGVVAVNADGQITMFNRAAERLTGLPEDRARRHPLSVLPAALGEPLERTIADGQARTLPEISLAAGHTTRPVICTTSPLHNPDRGILGAVAVFSDLTPLKELEVERRRAERLGYFEALASGIAHEIKNPLVAIKTFTQLIPRRHDDARFVDEFSRVVTREISRMERLLERLRALSRPGERPRHPLDLRAPLQEAAEFLRPGFEEKRVKLVVRTVENPAMVRGDHGELEQLFLNLIMNAHEATPPGGIVEVDVTADAGHIGVAIADSGPGIPPELLDRVFDPFFTTKQHGSGLGLTISAGIAAAHEARLHVANRPNGGALFTVDFLTAASVEAPLPS